MNWLFTSFVDWSAIHSSIISWCNSFIKGLINGANNYILSNNLFFDNRETEMRATKIIDTRLIYVILTCLGNQYSNYLKCAFQYFQFRNSNSYWLFNYSTRPSFRLFNGKSLYWIYIQVARNPYLWFRGRYDCLHNINNLLVIRVATYQFTNW